MAITSRTIIRINKIIATIILIYFWCFLLIWAKFRVKII